MIAGPADFVTAAERAWPEMYVTRADGAVLAARHGNRPRDLRADAATAPSRPDGGDQRRRSGVGYGSDVARLRPPA